MLVKTTILFYLSLVYLVICCLWCIIQDINGARTQVLGSLKFESDYRQTYKKDLNIPRSSAELSDLEIPITGILVTVGVVLILTLYLKHADHADKARHIAYIYSGQLISILGCISLIYMDMNIYSIQDSIYYRDILSKIAIANALVLTLMIMHNRSRRIRLSLVRSLRWTGNMMRELF
jgi:hypothetical protein